MIGMSGGVDSSVAAWLLLQKGYDCTGATMRLYTGQTRSHAACCMREDWEDARNVAQRLGIPFHLLDYSEAFQTHVIENFVDAYERGLTPNPCIECNRHLKFGRFLQSAQELGCGAVATGHYAGIVKNGDRFYLKKALDTAKDQTYFLYSLTQHQLAHALFPLGELTKAAVREIAEAQGFLNARKRDSQDICFIPDGDYPAFLQHYTGKAYAPGKYLDLQGNVVGQHKGAVCYTLGQRKGLNIAMGAPVYVCAKDMQKNTVTIGPNEALCRSTLVADQLNWFPSDNLTSPVRVMAKARSRMVEQPATIYPEEGSAVRVVFDEAQRALTPGQAVVFYDGDLVLGGGRIWEVL